MASLTHMASRAPKTKRNCGQSRFWARVLISRRLAAARTAEIPSGAGRQPTPRPFADQKASASSAISERLPDLMARNIAVACGRMRSKKKDAVAIFDL